MIGGGISLFGFEIFRSVRKIIADARAEALSASEAFAPRVKDDHEDQEVSKRDDNLALFWSVHLGY